MKKETEQAFNTMVEEMRMKGNKLKKFIFMDRETKSIWSFDKKETFEDFMKLYVDEDEVNKLHFYNNGNVVSLHGE